MFTVHINGTEFPDVYGLEVAKLLAKLHHLQFEASVDVVDCETGEVMFSVIDRGSFWEIYEAEPDVIEVFDSIIIEI